jgi:hypothetical protein
MRQLLLCTVFYIFPQLIYCQNSSIEGRLFDSTNKESAVNAVISILNKDSTLVTFSRSNKNGDFKISKIQPGEYLILITYPGYADYIEQIQLKPQESFQFQTIYLTEKAKLLEEIVIRQSAIRIMGDTTQFTADSFHVKANASVEDLLKQLPGIQVDKDGKITAQGKQVQKVLVDGDEFFSDDPTIATRNLRADAVDKVQLLYKQSDQAAFTGIDDGEKTRTLNLKLKDNAKHGYFGKLSAGALDKYYNGQALINAFKAKRKLAAFAITSSTDQTGLNWQDSRSYGFSNDNIEFDGGSISITLDAGSDLGVQNFYGQGLPESVKAGLHFSNKWSDDKYNGNGNYVFNKMATHSNGNTYRQNILKDSVYYDRDFANAYSDQMKHTLSGILEIQIDSSSSLKVTAFGSTGTSESSSQNHADALSEENKLVNSSLRNTSSNGNNSNLNATVLWRKKFKKKGRTISISFDNKRSESNSKGFLNNRSDFYDADGFIFRTDTTDQNKVNDISNNVTGARTTYTEPLSSKSFLEFNYSFYNNNSKQKILSYDKDLNGKYAAIVDSLSNDFKYIYNTNSAGINYRFNAKKVSFSLGGNFANTGFKQTDMVKDTTRKYDYNNLFPQATFRYKFSSFSNLSFNYRGRTTQPTIDQLQPLKNNNDPMNIITGNPSLKQQFQNNLNLSFSKYQVLNQRYIYVGTDFSFTEDEISNSYTIDSLGRKVSKYINIDGNYSGSLNGTFMTKIPKTSLTVLVSPRIRISKFSNFVNGEKNTTHSNSVSTRFLIRATKNEVYEITAAASPAYNRSISSLSTVAGTKYWSYDYTLDGNYQLPWKLEIGSDVQFNLRQKINAFDVNNNVILWNAYIEKKFLKTNGLTLRASINDILDQNKGYSRTIQPYAIEEKNYLTFRRYGLITLTYNFNNKGGSPAPSGRNIVL